jgi:GT2 family glycosyltransferase
VSPTSPQQPTVSIVFLAYNRREELAVSLTEMLERSSFPRDRLQVIVVDNASTDDTAAMVRSDFPAVELVVNPDNVGASGWNAGFARATGDYVLILDDDCYLPGDHLADAVAAAERERADLVSFSVVSSFDTSHSFNGTYATGLLSYWGCAALVSRRAIDHLQGYDPYIFIWANELEFTARLLDAGFRHLFLPSVTAVHMKAPGGPDGHFLLYPHRMNNRHYAYVAGKLLRTDDAIVVAARLALQLVLDTVADDRSAVRALPDVAAGFAAGVRRRAPMRRAVSRLYRDDFRAFAPPRHFLRTPLDRLRRRAPGAARQVAWFAARPDVYPRGESSLAL